MNLFDANGNLDRAAVIAVIRRAGEREVTAARRQLAEELGPGAEAVWKTLMADAKYEQLRDETIAGLTAEIDNALAATGAAVGHLHSLSSGSAYHENYDGPAGRKMLEQFAAAAEALRAAQAANPVDLAAEKQKQLLADLAAFITPCAPPDVVNGYDLDWHGGSWPCEQTKLAWRLRGLDPAAEAARIMREASAEMAMAHPGGADPDDET